MYCFNKYLNVLDNSQLNVVYNNSKYLLVVAGAGSGKTFTIVSKILYLINVKKILPSDILCISFTNESVKSLKNKIGNERVDVMTFHKLGMKILQENNIAFEISSPDYLEYITHEFFFGITFENAYLMKNIMKYFKKKFIFFNISKKYKKFIYNNYNKIISLEKLIDKFIRLLKTNNYSLESFIGFKKRAKSKKEIVFLSLVINIYLIYINELESSMKIDFDDMLVKSRLVLDRGGIVNKYKYIIIDEYQDTSYIRYLLINSIMKKTDASLIAVGDDFQSIYRFSGCDLKIFTQFNNYYKDACVLKLENTYRNSIELVDVAGRFIMKDKNQIIKNMKSKRSISKPIKICYGFSLKQLIVNIKGNIMILGRNNNDINKYIDKGFVFDNHNLYIKDNSEMNIKYYTVHRSKGLEADNVIILNAVDDDLGFPNKIEDDSILKYVSVKSDYRYDEERRLFYVALTRTRNNVYIMTSKNKESIFIKEILNDNKDNIEIIKNNRV